VTSTILLMTGLALMVAGMFDENQLAILFAAHAVNGVIILDLFGVKL
jgi:hypothetical protein